MADQVALATSPRAGSGKGEARALRRQGRVPAIAYGIGLDATPISVDGLELYHALHTDAGENAILRLQFDGDDHLALARELQRHPVRGEVLHVDFVTVSRTQTVQVDVPIVLEGDAPGASEGGVVEQALYALAIEVLPLEVPDQIVLDISDLQVGDVKRVEDLALPSGVTALVEGEEPVVTVVVPQLEVPETEEAVDAEVAEEEAEGATAEEAEETAGEDAADGDEE